jgi:hypothetical protein
LQPDRQAEFALKRSEGYKEGKYVVWNSGLTKETSPKIAAIAKKISETLTSGYESGSIVDWHAKDPQKSAEAAAKASETKKAMFSSGELSPWNLGLTKETSPSLAAAADKISARYDRPDAGHRIKLADLESRILAHSTKFQLVSPLEDYRRRRVERMTFLCLQCGQEQKKSLAMLEETPVCFHCHPKESKGQLEVLDFVRSLGVDAVSSDRTVISPLEIDVLVPSFKLAIEYDGLYWHSVKNLPDKMHAERKRLAVEAAGYKFFGIYEDEWRDKRPIVEGMIRHRLGLSLEVLNARSLKVEKLSGKEVSSFFEMSHLEGHTSCSTAFALTQNGKIIAAMSLRKPFHASKSSHLEVARSAALPGVSVRGWLGRLTSAALKYAKSAGKTGLMTYVDARVGSGAGYASGLWKMKTASTGPRFWWTDYHDRFNRFKYRANKSEGLTQEQVAESAGVVEIWGCGNYVYVAE